MPSRVSAREARARRRAGTPPAESSGDEEAEVTLRPPRAGSADVSGDEVTFRTAAADATSADPEDDVSTLAGSDDEAPDAVGLPDARREAEALLEDLANSRKRKDDARRQRDRERQERNRDQKLDKQRRLEQELMDELADELAEEEEEAAAASKGGAGGKQRIADGAAKPKRKRFQYPTPEAVGALDFIPLAEGESTAFKAAALPTSQLPAVVNPALLGLRERLLYSGRIPRTSSKGLKQLKHKQQASGKYGRR